MNEQKSEDQYQSLTKEQAVLIELHSEQQFLRYCKIQSVIGVLVILLLCIAISLRVALYSFLMGFTIFLIPQVVVSWCLWLLTKNKANSLMKVLTAEMIKVFLTIFLMAVVAVKLNHTINLAYLIIGLIISMKIHWITWVITTTQQEK